MKKLLHWCTAGLIMVSISMFPGPRDVKAAGLIPATGLPTEATLTKEEKDLQLSYVQLDESEKNILDEILSDYVSEEVVRLADAGVDYEIKGWMEKGTHTYLFLEKRFPEKTVYTACGYAQTGNGEYVYFELTSPAALTEEMVDKETQSTFFEGWISEKALC